MAEVSEVKGSRLACDFTPRVSFLSRLHSSYMLGLGSDRAGWKGSREKWIRNPWEPAEAPIIRTLALLTSGAFPWQQALFQLRYLMDFLSPNLLDTKWKSHSLAREMTKDRILVLIPKQLGHCWAKKLQDLHSDPSMGQQGQQMSLLVNWKSLIHPFSCLLLHLCTASQYSTDILRQIDPPLKKIGDPSLRKTKKGSVVFGDLATI